ncbi:MAG: DUF3883 domain-containing protein, partial [Lactobacillus sp.]
KYSDEDDKRKKDLGDKGEKLIYEYEKARLKKIDPKLEDKVEWVAQRSDKYHYDVRSYDPDAKKEIHIEVKTTSDPQKKFIFYMSAQEWERWCDEPDKYYVYRVFYNNDDPSKSKIKCIHLSSDELGAIELGPASSDKISLEVYTLKVTVNPKILKPLN